MQDKTADIQHEDIQGVRVIELCTRIDIHNVFAVEETLTRSSTKAHKGHHDFSRIELWQQRNPSLMLAKRKLDHLGGRLFSPA